MKFTVKQKQELKKKYNLKCRMTLSRNHIWQNFDFLIPNVNATQHFLKCQACKMINDLLPTPEEEIK